MSSTDYVSPFSIHNKEEAARHHIPLIRRVSPNASPTGQEIACNVGAVGEEPIPALFHPASRTVFPVRDAQD